MADEGLVVIGRVGRPHGVGGELRATPTGATLASILPGEEVVVAAAGDRGTAYEVVGVRSAGQGVVLRLGGVESRGQAAQLAGAALAVTEGRLATLTEPGEFYVRDLIGCAVSVGDAELGEVVDVHQGTANDALLVGTASGEEILIPFTRDAIVGVDVAGRSVRVRGDLLGWERSP